MIRKTVAILILAALILPGCMFFPDTPAVVKGSGNVVSETREVSGITSIVLEGSADVNVTFGTTESLVITGEDNIIPLIETNVQNNQLTIKTKPLTTYSTTKPVVVNVTVTTLKGVSISGSGNITVPDMNSDTIHVDLPGSGTITLAGIVNSLDFDIGGSGNIFADELKAKSAKVVLGGSGTIKVNASESLDATLSGSGNILYSGNPPKITKNVTGSGSISG